MLRREDGREVLTVIAAESPLACKLADNGPPQGQDFAEGWLHNLKDIGINNVQLVPEQAIYKQLII